MEYRRRTLSSVIDVEVETVKPHVSIDDNIDDYTEYVYNGTFSFCKFLYRGLRNLICPCFKPKYKPLIIESKNVTMC